MDNKIWKDISQPDADLNKNIADKFNISTLTSKILINRDIKEDKAIEKFLNAEIKDLYDPFLFSQMEKIVQRINQAVNQNKSIWIYGDYDVDGITSTAVLYRYLKTLGAEVNYYLPNRQKEGYGLSKEGIQKIFNAQGSLIITVDCGITAVEEVAYVKELGMDIIITDHHKCGTQLPKADGILNPKIAQDNYPFDMLAGVGIAFKLMQALAGSGFEAVYQDYIDLVSLGTIADLVPLIDENRIIVKNGLVKINETENIGLKKLIAVSSLSDKIINSGHIGFVIAPKINAAGRLGAPEKALELLVTDDEDEAEKIAEELDSLNNQRQLIEEAILIKSKKMIEDNQYDQDNILVVFNEKFHSGVIGIVASRLVEEYNKPAIVLTEEEGIIKGSARSIGNFDIYKALNNYKDLFSNFGGHKLAAGLSMDRENIDSLRQQLNTYIEREVDQEDIMPVIKYDGKILPEDITIDTINELDVLEPYGIGNPKPKFLVKQAEIVDKFQMGKSKKHVKFLVDYEQLNINSIGFNKGYLFDEVEHQQKIDFIAKLDVNDYNGLKSTQLLIEDLLVPNGFALDEYAYNKSLSISILNNISYFLDLDFHKVFKTKETFEIDHQKNNLIVVQNKKTIEKLDKTLDLSQWNIYYNVISENDAKDLLINPVLKRINIEYYDQIHFYDIPLRKENYHLNSYYQKNDLIEIKEGFKNIPDRSDLIIIYKLIAQNKKCSLSQLNDFSSFSDLKILLSILILNKLDIIKFRENNKMFKFKINNGKKIDLENNHFFTKMMELKEVGETL